MVTKTKWVEYRQCFTKTVQGYFTCKARSKADAKRKFDQHLCEEEETESDYQVDNEILLG